MPDRRAVPWIAGFAAVVLVTGGLGSAMIWWSADLQMQADAFWRTANGSDVDPELLEYYNSVFSNGWTLQGAASPVLAGAVIALIAALAVLARLWDRAHR